MKIIQLILIVCLCSVSVYAYPPPVPSAGVVEREIEKEYEAKPLEPRKNIPSIQIDLPEEKLDLPHGKKVHINRIEIKGSASISSKEIKRWLKNALNKSYSIKEIYEICALIEQRYAEEGYFLARAYPPPQEVEGGVITLEVIEGRLGDIKVVGNKHYSTKFIQRHFAALKNGALQYDRFVRALLLLNENSDCMAGAIFEKGQEFGTVDLIIRVEDARPVHLYLNGNNYGRDLTTSFRAGGRLDAGNVVTYGDMLSVAEVVGFPLKDLYFTDVVYNFPLTTNGASMELAYLFSKFHIEELQSLHLRGQSNIATIKGSFAAGRWRTLSVDVFGSFDYKQIQNFVLGSRTSYDKLRVATLGLLVDHYNPSQGRDYFVFKTSAGIPHFLGGLKSVDRHSSRVGGGGLFVKFNADYDRLQILPGDCYIYAHGSGQYSPYKLTLPEVLYLGGADTVRGYPLAAVLGDSGYYANLELRTPLPFVAKQKTNMLKKKINWREVVQLVGFIDHGGAYLHAGATTYLTGVGCGVRLNLPYTINFSADVGWPLERRKLTNSAFFYFKLTGQPF